MTRLDPAPELPPLVKRYLERALPERQATASVRVAQRGEMWLKPSANSRRFSAVQEYAVSGVAFSWRARFPLASFVSLRVVDQYAAGEGSLEVQVFGVLPVMRQTGPETSLGEALRYLAELPWVPHAMAANPELAWRELDERTIDVATRVGPVRAAVTLEFDCAGDITGPRCEERPYPQGTTFVPRPWAGSFWDYTVLGGIRVPVPGEVRSELPEGPYKSGISARAVRPPPGSAMSSSRPSRRRIRSRSPSNPAHCTPARRRPPRCRRSPPRPPPGARPRRGDWRARARAGSPPRPPARVRPRDAPGGEL